MSEIAENPSPFVPAPATAKLFAHGGSQAVRLPKAFRFEGDAVTVRREGRAVILEPIEHARPRSPAEWEAFWSRIDDAAGADFPKRDQPPPQERDLDW
ncbi:MAG: antitoxin [Caulobacteraceae bacterium]